MAAQPTLAQERGSDRDRAHAADATSVPDDTAGAGAGAGATRAHAAASTTVDAVCAEPRNTARDDPASPANALCPDTRSSERVRAADGGDDKRLSISTPPLFEFEAK